MKKLLFLFLACLLAGITVAQTNFVGVNVIAYQPLTQWQQNIDCIPMGFSMSLLRSNDHSRFSYGLESGLAMYNYDTYEIDFQGERIEVQEEDCFFNLKTFVRYDLLDFEWSRVYAEGKVGSTLFFSSTSSVDCSAEEYNGNLKSHGMAFNMGIGGGILLNPTVFSSYDEDSKFWIDLGASTNSGSPSTYSINGNPEVNESEAITANSFTHYIDYRIGLIIKM